MVGRKSHDFWKVGKFTVVSLGAKNGAWCQECGKVLKNTSKSRLVAHRNLCNTRKEQSNEDVLESQDQEISVEFCPEIIADMGQPSISSPKVDFVVTKSPQNSSKSQDKKTKKSLSSKDAKQPTPYKRLKMDKKMSTVLDNMSDDDTKSLNIALGELVIGCNLPFHIVDSLFFKSFIKKLKPAYQPACSQTLSTTVLNDIYQDVVKDDCKNVYKDSVMLIDGWTNTSTNTKLVVTILQSINSSEGVFLDAVDLTTETDEALAKVCYSSIELAKERYNTEIYAVVSDNATNLMTMGNLTSPIIHTTCSSHTGNLLADDVFNKELVGHVMTILEAFRHPDNEKLVIISGGSKITLAVDSTWCTYRDCFSCFVENLSIMKHIAANHPNSIETEVIQLLFNNDIEEDAKEALDTCSLVCQLINSCQAANCNLADAANMWLQLKLPDKFAQCLKQRQDIALNKYSLTAYFLHNIYKGKDLNTSQRDEVDNFLYNYLDSSGLNSLGEFMDSVGIFATLDTKGVDAITYWRLAERKHENLSKLALKLLAIPASSAQLERVFSNWGFVHNDVRNRLSGDECKKLIHCYYSLTLREGQTQIEQ